MILSAPQLAATPARILIVEDEGLVADDLSDLLSTNGYAVAGIAESSQSALSQVEDLKPDLILMDIRIKGALDGIETAAKLRERFDIPVVYLTAHTDNRTVDRAKMTGAFGFLTKPIDSRSLTITIEMAIHKHRADRTIRHQRSWMAAALGTMANAMAVIDRGGKIQFLNGPAEALTGWTNEQSRGMDIAAILPLKDAVSGLNKGEVLAPPSEPRPHSWLPRHLIASKRSGEPFAVAGAISASVEGGMVVGAVITFHDATVRNAQDNEIRHKDKMEAVGRLAAGIAHDFNNLLFVIIELTEEMLLNASDEADLRSLHEIRQAGKTAATITQQLLSFSRKNPVEKQDIDLNAIIRDTEELLRRVGGPSLVWKLNLHRETRAIRADPGQLKQVLMNLVANARDATPGAGSITIETSNVDIRHAEFTSETGDDFVSLSVTDTGTGMSADTAERLFEPFFTTKARGSGTGLGLSIVHSIVMDHGGTIHVDSAPGSGTTFTICLPRAQASTGGPVTCGLDASKVDGSNVAAPATILLVGDREVARRLIYGYLARAGYKVLEAPGGLEAIRIATEHAGTIDLMISDIGMRDANGFDVARIVADRQAETKIILISGHSGKPLKGAGNPPPGAHLLSRPFTRTELLKIVNALLTAEVNSRTMKASL